MLHHAAELTPFGPRLLVDRILIEGWPPATAAEMVGVRGATADKVAPTVLRRSSRRSRGSVSRPLCRPRALPVARPGVKPAVVYVREPSRREVNSCKRASVTELGRIRIGRFGLP
jgi:hypothetical protein